MAHERHAFIQTVAEQQLTNPYLVAFYIFVPILTWLSFFTYARDKHAVKYVFSHLKTTVLTLAMLFIVFINVDFVISYIPEVTWTYILRVPIFLLFLAWARVYLIRATT